MNVVRQQALTVVAPVTLGREVALDAWLRESRRELQRALARSSTTHFARWPDSTRCVGCRPEPPSTKAGSITKKGVSSRSSAPSSIATKDRCVAC